MKKFFKLMLLSAFLSFSFGAFAQPTAAPPAPSHPVLNVISIYGSDTYTPIIGVKSFEDWGQTSHGSTIGDYTIPGTEHKVLKYGKLSFQGIDFTDNTQDVSAMKFLHLDIWTEDAAASPLWIALISGNQNIALSKTITTDGSWYSLDIPLAEYVGSTLTSINQLMFTSNEWRTYATNDSSVTIYLDNIYFWTDENITLSVSPLNLSIGYQDGSTNTFDITTELEWTVATDQTWLTPSSTSGTGNATITLTATANNELPGRPAVVTVTASDETTRTVVVVQKGSPVEDAPTPALTAANVKSIFSDAYTSEAATFQDWFGTAMTEDSSVTNSNKVKKVTSSCCFGYEFPAPMDMTMMTNLHVDIYPVSVTAITIGIVANGEHKINKPLTANMWNSIDISLLDLTTAGNLASVSQLGFWDLSGTFYLDNLLFYSGEYSIISGIENGLNADGINFYPNPVKSYLFIDGLSQNATLKIFDVGGKLLVERQNVNQGIEVENLSKGVYFIKISDKNIVTTKKFIKE